MNAESMRAPAEVGRAARAALVAGIVGLVLCGAGGAINSEQFFRSWLVAWVFWTGISLGCLGILMIQHLTGGAWGIVIRRPLEAAARTLPLAALLFVPLLAGLRSLYPWARPELVAADAVLKQKALYLNVPFFITRAVIFFAAWILIAFLLTRWSRAQDGGRDPGAAGRMGALAAPGILVYVLTMTFASVDWIMSLEPHWYSTLYGGLIIVGQGLAALCFTIWVLCWLSQRAPLADVVKKRHLHDLGKLLLAFTMVWSYFAFSQFLIIWAGNLPEEIPWYLKRLAGGWQWVALALVLFQFAAPFLLLLSASLKKDAKLLARVAALAVVMRLVDTYWTIIPAFRPGAIGVHWLDVVAPVGIGGIWLFVFLRQLERAPLVPIGEPELAEALGEAHA